MDNRSLETMLAAIPSQASNLALACVERILEDQIQNPAKIAKNLKRIASVVSDWSLKLSGQMHEAGDGIAYHPYRNKVNLKEKNPLLSLPTKARCKIWSYLETEDLLRLRLVCSKIQCDIDLEIGLPVVLDSESESMEWIRRITANKCFITRLNYFFCLNFLPRPDRMIEVRFHPDVIVPPELLNLIVRKFQSLRTLSFYSQDLFEIANGKEIVPVSSPSVTEDIFRVLDDTQRLTEVVFKFEDATHMSKWDLVFQPIPTSDTVMDKSITCRLSLDFTIPRHQLHQQKDCILMLERQSRIHKLTSDLENMNWKKYCKPISQNAHCLTVIHLNSLATDKGPFDCEFLKGCKYLRHLSISGNPNSGVNSVLNIIGVRTIPRKALRILDLENVHVTKQDYDVIEVLRKTVWVNMRLCRCGKDRFIGLALRNDSGGELQHIFRNSKSDGHTVLPSYNNKTQLTNDGYGSDSDIKEMALQDELHPIDTFQRRKGKIQARKIVQQISLRLLMGVLLTAYLAVC